MKTITLLYLFGAAFSYKDIDDNVNIEQISHNQRDMKQLIDCVLDKGPCSKLIAAYKQHSKEILDNSCANCDQIQKHQAHILVDELKKDYPESFKEIKAKYDKTGGRIGPLEKEVDKF